ncbi:MAG: prolyl oligopeptidase family serine peptidase [Gemmatimonadaceae bacterium]|nr:prolyl oligopeptidase family serine peptidase [Gemmatimonadaceae bacterium]
MPPFSLPRVISGAVLLTFPAVLAAQAPAAKRPMTWLDAQHMRGASAPVLSPDGRYAVYSLSTPDWKAATTQTDLYLVPTDKGAAATRQLTFTTNKNESSPQWAPSGGWLVFASNREAPTASANQQQLFVLHPDGGEARRITNAREGVSTFAFSRDGAWLVYRSGKDGEEQLYVLATSAIARGGPADSLPATALTKQPAGVDTWRISPDSKRVYFLTADTVDADERKRREMRFTVNIRNAEEPTVSMWVTDIAGAGGSAAPATRLTRDPKLAVTGFTISPDGRWVGFNATPNDRYKRNVTEEGIYADVYLLDTQNGQVERLTDNAETSESALSFSPDSKQIAFSSSDDMTRYNMKNRRVYLRDVAARGQPFRKIGDLDGDVAVNFWSADGKTIYFNEGWRATQQLFALDVASGKVKAVTNVQGVLSVSQDEVTKRFLVSYQDPATPSAQYLVPTLADLGKRAAWVTLAEPNNWAPQQLALGDASEFTWTSSDGKPVGGVLLKPVGYKPGTRYPLIVAIHGGPAAADQLSFNGGYGAQVYAGQGWMVLMPNYRGSTNYGEAHKNGIVGNYFPPGYEDIMTGVDALIKDGMVDSTRMGVLGWSAGGHWSNWILTHTNRFKAISSGAGTSNWISMYAQSDVQRNRQHYLGDKLPYDDFDAYWKQSPIQYIRNAKTPTMIHVVEGDPRVPSPQSVELHMGLKRVGVPTELFMYPGNSHGIPDARNRMAKSASEMAWMDYHVLGKGEKFSWREVLKTLETTATLK